MVLTLPTAREARDNIIQAYGSHLNKIITKKIKNLILDTYSKGIQCPSKNGILVIDFQEELKYENHLLFGQRGISNSNLMNLYNAYIINFIEDLEADIKILSIDAEDFEYLIKIKIFCEKFKKPEDKYNPISHEVGQEFYEKTMRDILRYVESSNESEYCIEFHCKYKDIVNKIIEETKKLGYISSVNNEGNLYVGWC